MKRSLHIRLRNRQVQRALDSVSLGDFSRELQRRAEAIIAGPGPVLVAASCIGARSVLLVVEADDVIVLSNPNNKTKETK
jgi:hypothetical protein